MVDILSRIGVDRTFEFIEFLILFFVLVSAVTLISVFINNRRSKRKTRMADRRVEAILRHLGRDLFGEEAWAMVEQTLTSDRSRIDSFLSVLDRESFDSWADRAQRSGEVPVSEIEQLRSRLTHPGEARRHLAPVPVAECNPTFGLPVAVQQDATQTRGTIADVDSGTFTLWVLGEDNQFDDSREASFVLLSRSGTFQFDSHFHKLPDDSLVVQKPAHSLQSQRRRFDRYPARIPAYIVRLRGDVTPIEVTITELSGGGATLTDPSGLFDEGQILNLSFDAGGKSYKVTGRIVRADDGALHIRFEAMRDQERLEIAKSVAVIEPAHIG